MSKNYDEIANRLYGNPAAQLNASLSAASATNPDEHAKSVQLGRELGVPSNVVSLDQKAFDDKAKLERAKKAVKYDTVAAKWLANPDNAKLAHDDVDNLGLTEKAIHAFGEYGLRPLGGGTYRVAQGVNALLGFATSAGGLADNPLSEYLYGLAKGAKDTAETMGASAIEGGAIAQGYGSAVESLTQMAFTGPFALESAGANAATQVGRFAVPSVKALLPAGVMTGGQALQQGKDAGLSPLNNLLFAAQQGTVEMATEAIPFGESLKFLDGKSSILKTLGKVMIEENVGEQVATHWQDLNEWLYLHPEKTAADYLAERPDAALQTAIATTFAAGIQTGALHIATRAKRNEDQAQKADHLAGVIEQLNTLAQASKVAQRDTDTFEGFIEQATKDGPVQDVYIDAETFAQSGIAAQVMEVSPSVQSQYAEALATGGTIRIPVSEYVARIATQQELSGPLLEHLKTDPMGFSKSEVATYQKEQGKALEAEIASALEQAQGDDAFNASRDAVKQSMLDQLNAVGRNTPAVNEAYASLFSARTAVRAKQLGITPEEMAQKQLLRVQGEKVGGQGLSQSETAKEKYDRERLEDRLGRVRNIEDDYRLPNVSRVVPKDYVPKEAAQKEVTIYRGVPSTIDGASIRPGDWVSFDKKYAKQHGTGETGKSKVVSMKVPAEHIAWAGTDMNEWFYAPPLNDANIPSQEDYMGEHRPPGMQSGAPLYDLTGKGNIYPDDVYGPNAVQYYGTGDHSMDAQTMSILHSLKNKPNREVTIYRAVPYEPTNADKAAILEKQIAKYRARGVVPEGETKSGWYDRATSKLDELKNSTDVSLAKEKINPGDWVTVNRNYAKYHGESALNGKYKIISKKVRAKEVFTNGDSIHEAGYWPGDTGLLRQSAISPTDANILKQSAVSADFGTVESAKQILDVMETTPGTWSWGLRRIPGPYKVKAGDDLPPSKEWDWENDMSSDDDMDGVSTIGLDSYGDESDVMKAIRTLEKAGYSGTQTVLVRGDWSRGGDDVGESVITNPIAIAVWNGADKIESVQLFQTDRGGFSPSQNIITLLKNADLSTFLHEAGHYFFENDIALANELIAKPERTAGEQQILDDVDTLLKWFGLEGDLNERLDQWNQMDFETKRGYHERVAESFEAYLFSGKAPSIELSPYFQKFREFMLQVYKSLKQFLAGHPEAGKLNDEVRGVFDRMLATEEQIQLAEQARSMLPLFKTAEEASKFGVDFEAYQALAKGSTQAAVDALQAKGLKDMQWLHNAHGREVSKLKKQSEALRREIRAEVRTEIMQRPIYQAWSFLTRRMTEDDKLPKQAKPDTGIAEANRLEIENYEAGAGLNLDSQAAGRLDAAEVAALNVPHETIKRLEDFKMTRKTGGLHPDVVANLFGLSSGDDLVLALYDADPPQTAIEKATDARMLAEHGELATEEAIAKAADRALYNVARGKMLVADANALAKANEVKQDAGTDKRGRKRTINILPAAAKEAAANLINRVVIRNLRPAQYEAAEIKAGKATEKAKNAGKLEEAAAQARTRLFNHYAVMEAYRAQDEIEEGVKYLKKVQTPGKIPAEHFDQITAILDKFDLRQATNKKLDNTAMFQTWARAQLEAGNVPPNIELLLTPAQRAQFTREVSATTPDGQLIYGDEEKQAELLAGMLDQTPIRNYRQLTIEEFRGLVDTIKQIEHIGRRTKRVLTDRKKREFNAVVDEIKANIVAVATEKGRKSTDVRTPTDATLKKLLSWRGFWGSHIKVATSLNIMDGRDFGPLWEHLVQTANEAGNGEVLDGAEAYKAVDALLKPVKAQGNITDKAKYFPTINESLNRQERIVMALNLGNASNEQRLLGGKNWTRDQIQPVLDTLTAADWKFVQGMWDLFESYRPRVAAMEREINGVEPEWIEARPLQVKTADGQTLSLRGGYAPVIFDPRASGKAASFAAEKDAKAMMQAARVASTVNKSFTKARVTEVKGRPLLLSLDAMIGGIQDTIHYLHWQPWIIDANRLVKALDAPMREHYGAETVSQLRNWVGDNAAGTRPARDGAERAITNMARNVSFAGLAFNVVSAAQQITGYSQSVAVVGAKWMGKGLAKTLENPRKAFTEAAEKSSFMRKRGITRMRDLAETHTVVSDQGKLRTTLDETGYAMILAMQAAVDVPTWWAGYEKALDADVSEEEAIQRADQSVIDSQGSGMSKDLASVERATGAIRLMTGFMSFMNTTLNINYRIAKSDRSAGEKAVDFVLVNAIPVILSMLIKDALTPGGDDEDKDASEYAKKYAAEQFSFMMGQMVGFREIGQAGAGILGLPTFGYQGSTGTRIYADTLTLAQQVGQGEMDDALRKAIVNTAADFLRLPGAQINRTITGTEALLSDETDNSAAVLFGHGK